jgi:purine-cytosine permease-like protein
VDDHSKGPMRRRIEVFGRRFHMPQSRGARIAIGVALVVFGIFGFLPVLGFWMIPLGVLVLSYEFASVRRFRRRVTVWWERRRRGSAANSQANRPTDAN